MWRCEMTREIKFRGKQLENIRETDKTYASEKGTWRYGTYKYIHKFYGGVNAYMICDIYGREIMCDKETIGQFTGLLDKNGKEIYEGDVVRLDLNNLGFVIAEVNFREGCYCFDTPKDVFTVWNTDVLEMHIEVIGNIHD